MRLSTGVAAVASFVVLWVVASALSPDARPDSPRSLSSSASLDHLGEAIGRFARADRSLFAPDAVGRPVDTSRAGRPPLRPRRIGPERSTSLFGAPSHTPVAPIRPPAPTNTTAAYRPESSLFALADRQAHRDKAIMALVIRAYPAHDAAVHEVPTEMAWRAEGEQAGPVIRVHLEAGHVRFPVLMRFDVVTQS